MNTRTSRRLREWFRRHPGTAYFRRSSGGRLTFIPNPFYSVDLWQIRNGRRYGRLA